MPETMTTMTAHVRNHLGRHLAALYDGLPAAPLDPRLADVLRRLGSAAQGTGSKVGR